MNRYAARYVWLVTLCLLASTASAQGRPEAPPRPWERDVPADDKQLAQALFVQGVELHEQLLRDQAVARYEEALSHWENPDIRWNLAQLMKDMGQYLRAYEHLEAALAWGVEAFDEDDREKLIGMRRTLLRQHLAVVEVLCDQPGAEVALDGKPWFRGPGEARQVVLPGEHVITARKPGYFPVTRTIMLSAGARGEVTLSMSVDRIAEGRRWQPWMPWAVFGVGVATGMMGAALDWHSGRLLDDARSELAKRCVGLATCLPGTPRSYSRALWQHRIGVSTMVSGGTMTAAGVLLVFLNQPHAHRTENRDGGTFDLVPMTSPDTAGIAVRLRF